ncbi:MAG: AAA family ATPase, partial [Bacteroidales bacterium]|nr:AAA family ATPase [Bacteroidales bacterium]
MTNQLNQDLNSRHISGLLLRAFPYMPTSTQETAIEKLSGFIASEEKKRLFLLKGYAGTGKTSIVGVLVKILPQIGVDTYLMAPTGRAAKV